MQHYIGNGVRCVALLLGLVSIGACTRSTSTMPPLTLASGAEDDSLTLVRLVGPHESRTDTLRPASGLTELYPDTTRYRLAYVLPQAGRGGVVCYRLVGGAWSAYTPMPEGEGAVATTIQPIAGRDIEQRERHLGSLYRGGRLALVFSDLELRTLTRSERDSLRRMVRPDSLRFVYLYLTSSDSAARARSRTDSLQGTFFSDSAELVSRTRQLYGIERRGGRSIFLLDSTAQTASLVTHALE